MVQPNLTTEVSTSLEARAYLKQTDFSKKALKAAYPGRKKQISIRADTAVGKTSLTNLLRQHYPDYEFVYAGGIMRELAKERGLSVEEFARMLKEYPELDNLIDLRSREAALKPGERMIEGRCAHIMAPEAYSVCLICDLPKRTDRRFDDEVKEYLKKPEAERTGPPPNKMNVLRAICRRDMDDNARYTLLYPGYKWSTDNDDYDLVINTHFDSKEKAFEKVVAGYEKWLSESVLVGSDVSSLVRERQSVLV